MAEPANASIGSPYCNEEEISSNLLDACYWESFVKGSNAPSTFSADVHTAFEYVEVEINRIWRKNTASEDPLFPETGSVSVCKV